MNRQQRGIFFRKGGQKIDPPVHFSGDVALRVYLVSGSVVMTKAAVMEEVTIASPTPSPPRRATSQGLGRICLTSVTYSIRLDSWLEGVRVAERGAVLFFFSPATCLTFYLPAECVRLCVQRMFAQLMLCRCQSTSKCFLSSATTVGDVSTHSCVVVVLFFFLHTQQGW